MQCVMNVLCWIDLSVSLFYQNNKSTVTAYIDILLVYVLPAAALIYLLGSLSNALNTD